jgi:hypothetical protein
MELAIGDDKSAATRRQRLLVLSDRLAQCGPEVSVMGRGAPGAVGLDQHSRLEQILSLRRRDRDDKRSAPRIEREQTLAFQMEECLANRRAADTKSAR